MKKYYSLFFITVFLIIIISSSTNYFKNSIKKVEAIYLAPISVGDYVNCSGKIEYGDLQEILIDKNSIIKDIFVSAGQEVKKGDKIMTIIELPDDNDSFFIDKYKDELSKYNGALNIEDVYRNYVKQGDLQKIKNNNINLSIQNQKETPVFAATSGTISSLNCNVDSIVRKGDRIITIANSKGFQVRLNVNESRISDIKLGQKAIISGAGFKDRKYNGKVKSISNEAKQVVNTSGPETTVDVIVSFDNDSDNLENMKPGFTVKCKIQKEEHKNLLVVPYDMVGADNTGKEYVYKYKKGRAFKSYITTGKEFEEGLEVLNGIDEGDMIITTPDDLVHNKSYVKLI